MVKQQSPLGKRRANRYQEDMADSLRALKVPKGVILASSSPYRREQLARTGLQFSTVKPLVDEAPFKNMGLSPSALAQRLSEVKGLKVADEAPQSLVISGDQVAWFEHKVMSKAGTVPGAITQLERMSGHWHELHSAVTVAWDSKVVTHVDVARIRLRKLTRAEIEHYVSLDQSQDVAASYKFESAGVALVEEVETRDPSAIIGLPMIGLNRLIEQVTGLSLLRLARELA